MDELKTKQQVVDKLKQSEKVLVTVSKNPSVDELSAALGLALALDAQGKYATAIFSGETPPAIAFLEPEKTFDDTTDSLRDFIIALNKEKADHLRYKVVDDAVKIFITPYKTTITEDDLEFSQGDYNVELVVAIGVDSQEDLDSALDNHGQILHDAAIITVSAGDRSSTLGGIDWRDPNASSLSEMVASLVESLKKDKKEKILNASIATALLTGIVAETDRFSNEKTTSRAMTLAATLMSAGADQQLIANELQSAAQQELEVAPVAAVQDVASEPQDKDATHDGVGGLTIHHDEPPVQAEKPDSGETLAELETRILGEEKDSALVAAIEATDAATESVEAVAPVEVATPELPATAVVEPVNEVEDVQVSGYANSDEPLIGGTLNATTSQAADDSRREEELSQNRTILSHGPVGTDTENVQDPLTPAAGENPVEDLASTAASIAISGEKVIEPLQEALEITPSAEGLPVQPAPANAYGIEAAPQPALQPEFDLPMPPPIPDFSQQSTAMGPALPLPPTEPPQILGDILNPAPVSSAYSFDDTAAPATPSATVPVTPEIQPAPAAQPSAAYAPDPGQFQIPANQ